MPLINGKNLLRYPVPSRLTDYGKSRDDGRRTLRRQRWHHHRQRAPGVGSIRSFRVRKADPPPHRSVFQQASSLRRIFGFPAMRYRNLVYGVITSLIVSPTLKAESNELFTAAASGQLARVESLLAQGADVNAKNAAGRTALMAAAAGGNLRTLNKLITYGADVNLADGRGVTALMEAVIAGHEEAVHALIAAGADVQATDRAGVTVIDMAKRSGQTKMLSLLQQPGGAGQPPRKPETAETRDEGTTETGGNQQEGAQQ
jgi:hypothetical protein